MTDILRPLSGFQELMPEEQLVFDRMVDTVRKRYMSCGFVPLETPAVERKETLLAAKGGIGNQVYTVGRLQGEAELDQALSEGVSTNLLKQRIRAARTDMALRFDLTVPLARFVSAHHGNLVFPFRRYQIQPVWRGERAQAGRYRQFLQCDVDIVGNGELSLLHDAEIPSVIAAVLTELDVGTFMIRMSNMKILRGVLVSLGVDGTEQIVALLRIIDNLDKVGVQGTKETLLRNGLGHEAAYQLLELITNQRDSLDLADTFRDFALIQEGVSELRRVYEGVLAFGVDPACICIDLSIARGLDYYTGTVFETFLDDHREIGSVSSGGRYDNLTQNLGGRRFPGVGMTLGLSRLMSVLTKKSQEGSRTGTGMDVLVTVQSPSRLYDYISIAAELRKAGICTECVLDETKLNKQMRYANRKGFQIAVIANESELDRNVVQLKDLSTQQQHEVARSELVKQIQYMLG